MEKRYTQRPKRTTQKLRSEQKSVTPSPLSSEERKQLKANVPENILLDVQHVTTVADVKDLGEVLQEGMAKDKDESCDTEKARHEFGEALTEKLPELEQQTAQATQELEETMDRLEGSEKTFFKTAVDKIKAAAARIVDVFQSTEVEVYQAAKPGTCSTSKKYLKKAWSVITVVAGWAVNLISWIFQNPALSQFIFYVLRILRDQFCEWMSLKLGNWVITDPKSLFEKAKAQFANAQEFITRSIIIPFMASFFAPDGYFGTLWDMFSGNLTGVIDSISGSFIGPLIKGVSALGGGVVGGVIQVAGGALGLVTTSFSSFKNILFGAVKLAIQNGMQGLVQYYAFNQIYKDLIQIFWLPSCFKSVEIEINSDIYKQYVAAGYISPEQDAKYQEKLKVLKQKSFTVFDIILW